MIFDPPFDPLGERGTGHAVRAHASMSITVWRDFDGELEPMPVVVDWTDGRIVGAYFHPSGAECVLTDEEREACEAKEHQLDYEPEEPPEREYDYD